MMRSARGAVLASCLLLLAASPLEAVEPAGSTNVAGPPSGSAPLAAPVVAASVAATAPTPTPVAGAAAATAGGPAAAAAAPADDWIRPQDIPERADGLKQRLDAQLPDPSTVAAIEKIDAALTELAPAIRASLEQAHKALEGRNSLIVIQDAQRDLQQTSESFADWKKQLDAEARRVADVLDEVDQTRERWSRTRERPETAQAGDVVVRRVDASLAVLARNADELKAWRNRVLAIADRLLDDSSAVSEAVAKIEAATVAEGTSLFVPDHPPLWRRGLATALPGEIRQVPGRLDELRTSTQEYFALDARPFVLQALLAIALMFLFRALSRHTLLRQRLARTSPMSVRVLDRPYAVALLLALAASPAIHPTAPHRVTQLISLIGLFPVARVLTAVRQHSSPLLYVGLCALLIGDRLGMALSALPALRLAAILLELLLALLLAAEFARRLRDRGERTWLRRLLEAAMLAIALAACAEIGGWSSLGEMLGRGTLSAAILGIYVYAATISLEAVAASVLASETLRHSRFVDRNQDLVQRWAAVAVRLFGAILWLRLVLNALGLRNLASESVSATLAWGVSVGALSLTVGGVLAFAMTLFVVVLVSRLVHELLEDEIFPRTNLPRGIPQTLTTLAGYAIYTIGFLTALAAAGVHVSQLMILLGGLGVGIGLGLQDVVKNFAAGLTLLFERRVHVGDTVQIHDKNVFGRVLSIGMRASVVRNWNGTEAILPNDQLVSGAITNWTLSDGLQRIAIPVEVPGNADPRAVIESLLEVARADDRILKSPPPSALLSRFDGQLLHFVLYVWSDEDYESTEVRTSEIALAVHRALRAAGVARPVTPA